jgi:hypothetical protein
MARESLLAFAEILGDRITDIDTEEISKDGLLLMQAREVR